MSEPSGGKKGWGLAAAGLAGVVMIFARSADDCGRLAARGARAGSEVGAGVGAAGRAGGAGVDDLLRGANVDDLIKAGRLPEGSGLLGPGSKLTLDPDLVRGMGLDSPLGNRALEAAADVSVDVSFELIQYAAESAAESEVMGWSSSLPQTLVVGDEALRDAHGLDGAILGGGDSIVVITTEDEGGALQVGDALLRPHTLLYRCHALAKSCVLLVVNDETSLASAREHVSAALGEEPVEDPRAPLLDELPEGMALVWLSRRETQLHLVRAP